MSESTFSTANPTEASAGASATATVNSAGEPKATIASEPTSSPPVIDREDINSDLILPPSQATGADADNDSEAETLISSPVKKREALKKGSNRASDAIADDSTVKQEHQENPGDDHDLAENSTASKRDHVGADKTKRADNGDESDNLSEALSTTSSLDASDRQDLSPVVEQRSDASGEDDSDRDPVGKGEDQASNPRKRKHRESYIQAGMEPPRRRRRASDDGRLQSGDENGDSSSPKLRRHRRTFSAQSSATDPNRVISGGSVGVAASSSARQRRAATQFPTNDTKPTKNTWDSDTSSETSQRHRLTKTTRNSNRSTSTPGRPMPRDHKRHVNKYGFTRLAEACENGDLESVKEWRNKDPEQLEQREFAGNTPLQVASLNGYPEIVSYLLAENCNPHSANTDKDTPLIDAVENGHLEVVKLLLNAGVNPLAQNLKGQQALDLIDEDTDNFQEIRTALREAIEKWKSTDKGQDLLKDGDTGLRPGPSKELHFMAYNPNNLLRLAGENDQTGIHAMLQAQVQVTNEIVAAAAKTGDTFTVSMLLAEMKHKDAKKRPELPLLAVIGTSHFEMVKYLTGAPRFNPTWRSRSNGLTWYELAEQRQGANWEQEVKHFKELYDKHAKGTRLSSSPVSRRENGKRRRSPMRQLDSDVEADDPDTNEQARSKRRLVSKKVMREASRRRKSVSSSESDRDVEDDSGSLPVASKTGRARKTGNSTSYQPESHSKRRSSPTRDAPAPVDSGQAHSPAPEVNVEEEEKVKLEEMERQRLADEAAAAAAEAERQAELEAREAAAKLEEEKRKAEQLRIEEAAALAARQEAERKAEEDRVALEQRQAEERRLEREQRIKTFPSALQHVLSLTAGAKKKYILKHRFLPIQVVRRFELEKSVAYEDDNADELWMLNYQAAALLDHDSAADLLGLPQEPSTKQSAMSGAVTLEATPDHRKEMSRLLDSDMFTHVLHTFEGAPNLNAEMVIAEQARQLIAKERERFATMEPLHWVRFDDFYNAATSGEYAKCPHLSDLDVDKYRFDCCVDPSAFEGAAFEAEAQWNSIGVNGDQDPRPATNGAAAGGMSNGAPAKKRAGPASWGMATYHIVRD